MSLPPSSPPLLAVLRDEIDRIDGEIHAALVARGDVVGRVIAAKEAAGDTGSAFRPDREAALMRSIVLKNPGRWPVDAPENIWRVIVATSTYTQVPFCVHADISGGDAPMRESMRFHFGFTVPFAPVHSAEAVIAAVAASNGDLGMFRADLPGETAWWRGLEAPDAPKVIAKLPFAERADHPVGLPVFVISKPLSGGLARETILASVRAERWSREAGEALSPLGAALVCATGDANGANLLIAHPATIDAAALTAALMRAKCAPQRYAEVGCHAAHFAF